MDQACLFVFCFVGNSSIERSFTYRRIHPFEVYNSRVFSIFTELCSCCHNFKTFPSPKKETRISGHSSFLPSPRQPLISVSMDLPVLDISHKRNRTPCGLCDWLLSLGIMFSWFIHVVACVCTLFL